MTYVLLCDECGDEVDRDDSDDMTVPYITLSLAGDKSPLHFCDMDCLRAYVNRRFADMCKPSASDMWWEQTGSGVFNFTVTSPGTFGTAKDAIPV